ncbi:MAG: O-antigen/teichoic acid export membrane protein [Psychroserpens sp.]|jgi:O-antigen/teichoic acid export membrane protein
MATTTQRKISTALLKGSAFRVIQTFISIGIGFWMLPFLIANLGSGDYALWVLVGSIVSSYYLMDLGLNHAVTRYVSRYINTDEFKRANQIINTAIVIYSILGLVLFTLTLLGAIFLAPDLIRNPEDLRTAQAIILIAGLSISLEFPSKAFPGIIHAFMRFDTLALIRIIASIINAIAIYFFISNDYGIVSLAVISLVSNICTTSFYMVFCYRLLPSLKLTLDDVSKSDLKEIYHFSKWTFVVDLTNLLKQKMDLWLIAAFISGGAVTTYYVAVRLTEYATQFANQALGFTVPVFTKYYAHKQMDKLEESFIFFLKLNFIVLMLFIAGFTLIGDTFISLWIKDEIDHLLAYQCLIVLAIGRLLIFLTTPFVSLLMTIKQHKYSAYLSVVDTLVASISALYFIPLYGILGAAISFSLLVGIMRVIYLPYIVIILLGFKFGSFCVRTFIYSIYALFVYLVCSLYFDNIKGWIELLYASVMIVTLLLIGSFFIFSQVEKVKIVHWAKDRSKKTRL